MSFNAFAIMLKPFIANYLAPLEEDGTIAKLQADIALVAKSGAIPELAALVREMKRHNDLLQTLAERMNADGYGNFTAGPDTGTTGLDGDHRDGMPELPRAD